MSLLEGRLVIVQSVSTAVEWPFRHFVVSNYRSNVSVS